MTKIICRACGEEAMIGRKSLLAVCKNTDCDNWDKFATIGSDFFNANYMEV